MTYKHTANGVFDFSAGEIFLLSTWVEVFMQPKNNQPGMKFHPELNFNSSICNSPLRM